MPDTNPGLMTVFAEALERTDPADRAAYLDGACAGDAALRRRVEALLAAHDGAGRFLEPDATGVSEPASAATQEATGTSVAGNASPVRNRRPGKTHRTARSPRSRAPRRPPPRRVRRGPGHRRPVHVARGPRRGGDGHRLPGRADRTGQAAGGAEADQDRHGLAGGAGPVRRRAAGAGPDGPPQHRPRLRRRHHRDRPAVLRDGAGQRRADHRVLRPASAPGPGPAGAVRLRLPGGAARPPEGDHPPRPEAEQRPGHRGRRPARPEGHRLRRRQGDRVPAHRPEPRPTPAPSSARRRTCRRSRPTRRRWTSIPGPTSTPWA